MKVNIKQKNVFSFLYKAGEIKTQIWNKNIGKVNKKETQNATFKGINKGAAIIFYNYKDTNFTDSFS